MTSLQNQCYSSAALGYLAIRHSLAAKTLLCKQTVPPVLGSFFLNNTQYLCKIYFASSSSIFFSIFKICNAVLSVKGGAERFVFETMLEKNESKKCCFCPAFPPELFALAPPVTSLQALKNDLKTGIVYCFAQLKRNLQKLIYFILCLIIVFLQSTPKIKILIVENIDFHRLYINKMLSRRLSGFVPILKASQRNRIVPLLNKRRPLSFFFSTASRPGAQKMEFKTETKKLLDIVAKSLYTDSEVFIRELLSNASDALEKQRFTDQSTEGLNIKVQVFPEKNQVVIEDNGIGMSKDELINNLGTIAKSGSKEYIENLKESGTQVQSNIIGQFGVGFYSSFIVADQVEVISRKQGENANSWISDGSGEFYISQAQNPIERGTRVILHLRKDHSNFTDITHFKQIINKYSNFINFPISINGEGVNLLKAIWARDKKEVTEEEYQKFYEFMYGSDNYKYKMHFQSDVPLTIKTLLFIPKTHEEKFGFQQQKGEVSLYSKKILIKKDCKQILFPNFLRFIRGVVDCEDIPLNISRQNYQDSALMAKLRAFLTKRFLKFLKQEANKNPEEYNKWYQQFMIFIKEGSMDPDFKKDVVDLNRYEITGQTGLKTLKDYVNLKGKTQDRIFYMSAPNSVVARDSPYAYPLTKAGIPILISPTHIDEFIFKEIDTYEGLKFANIETDVEDVERAIKGAEEANPEKKEDQTTEGVKEEDITGFSLWLKNELQPFVDKVVVSKKKIQGPAMVISPLSSSMRQMAFMRKMMEENLKDGKPRADLRNLTFQYNTKDDLIVKLNEFRKVNPENASLIARQIFDNCCLEAGLQGDGKSMVKRINSLMTKYLQNQNK